MVKISGIIVPIITPMYENEEINYEELRIQTERMIEEGVDGIFAFGTNGEGYILNEKEKEKVLACVIETAAGRVPVYAGTGCIGTKDTIRQSQMAEAAGADVLSVITPSFAAASQEELYEHYRKIAGEVKIPLLLYNIPARTGNRLSPETVEKLSNIDNILGVKDSSGNFSNMLSYIDRTREREEFIVLSGNDDLICWCLMAGGGGGVSGCANVYPAHMSSIYDRFMEGDIEGAKKAQEQIREFRSCFAYGNPNTIVKTAVSLLGYPVGRCRAPFHRIPEEGKRKLEEVLAKNRAEGMH